MNIKNITITLVSILGLQVSAQEISSNEQLVKHETKISYLDSIKGTFVKDRMAACVDSLWLKELTSLDLYTNITEDIKTINLDKTVDYELSTAVFKERLKKMDEKSPFNIEYNPGLENLVKSWLKNRKKSFERLMAVSEYYFPMFEESLARQNVPLEIKYLAVVESALNPKAVSRVGATGLWQFMYQTGKQYDLNIDSYVDERSDPLKASDAAAQYMSNMYKIFGDWDLVLASYNSGPGNVAKAIRRSGGKQNYWNIRKYLPNETAGYVPAFLATMYIYEYHKEHGIVPERAMVKHFATDTIAIKRQLTFKQISDLLDIPVAQLQLLNPSFKMNTVPYYFDKIHYLRLPQEKIALFTSNEDKIYAYAAHEESMRERPYSQIAYGRIKRDSLYQDSTRTVSRTKFHKVRRGDNLSEIANRYDVTIAQIKKWNKLKNNKAPMGRSLKILTTETIAYKAKKKEDKQPSISKSESVASVDVKAAKEATKKLAASNADAEKENNVEETPDYYVVEAGDNLSAIARKFGVTVKEIKQWNNFDDDNLLAGTRIKFLKADDDAVASTEKDVKNVEYTVKKGDFLGIIAKKNDVSMDDIKQWNNLEDNNIHVGQKLIVKKIEISDAVADKGKDDKVSKKAKNNDHYYVQKGDSLFSIAKKYPGITVSDIKKWNGIKNESIKPGMKLKING
ncbi:MAG: LysM peptidoglycan-binding domain-containing protein [Flavobacterium sp.]|nr:MAG: LysM peptidoglycan-binding domain-containing protein [Flavobacterium sp.]